jgi:hydroxymethylpyrimidine/phosphomethylpyrimidine kinase
MRARIVDEVRPVKVVLSIAGSDSGGGAGIQADLKAFARCGVHGTTAITALTAQNTVGVTGVHPVPPPFIAEQVAAVHDDLGVDAVKIGMLGSAAAARAVAAALDTLGDVPVVLDPVMVAESGARLLDPDAQDALVELVLPRATVVTPNVPEARVLAGPGAAGLDGEALARAVQARGARNVVVTGGHRDEAVDVLVAQDGRVHEIAGPRHPDGAAHGSGCTHSSALAAELAKGRRLADAARTARLVAADAVRDGLRELGSGPGPVNVLGTGR